MSVHWNDCPHRYYCADCWDDHDCGDCGVCRENRRRYDEEIQQRRRREAWQQALS